MELLNQLTRNIGDGRYELKNPFLQKDLFDNNTDSLIVGDTTDDTLITIDYIFKLPIADRSRTGRFVIIVEGTSADIGDDYWFVPPEITGVTFGVSVVGTDVVLDIVTNSVGENPTLYYRIVKAP